MSPHDAFIILNMLPKIGPVRVRKLLDTFETPVDILSATVNDLLQTQGIGTETASIITHWRDHIRFEEELQEAKQRGIRIITQASADYPAPLKNMYDPPLALYIWGNLQPSDQHAIAVVGSRKTTHYGQDTATAISTHLAASGLTIISGLARGIDAYAHQGAIQAKGRTIAVIGSGLAQLYPRENYSLAEKIAQQHGAVISEFPLHQRPDKKTFPMRNRIVAGWSSGILVVECPKWSGSLITANLGLEMGKSIYAIPGPIDRPTSAGCNQLIRDGATLVTSAQDILEDLQSLPVNHQLEIQPDHTPPSDLTQTEQLVFAHMSKEELLIDQLLEKTHLPLPMLMSTLLSLEVKRLVRQLPGPRFTRRH